MKNSQTKKIKYNTCFAVSSTATRTIHYLNKTQNKKKSRTIMQRIAVMKKNKEMKNFQVHQYKMSNRN